MSAIPYPRESGFVRRLVLSRLAALLRSALRGRTVSCNLRG